MGLELLRDGWRGSCLQSARACASCIQLHGYIHAHAPCPVGVWGIRLCLPCPQHGLWSPRGRPALEGVILGMSARSVLTASVPLTLSSNRFCNGRHGY